MIASLTMLQAVYNPSICSVSSSEKGPTVKRSPKSLLGLLVATTIGGLTCGWAGSQEPEPNNKQDSVPAETAKQAQVAAPTSEADDRFRSQVLELVDTLDAGQLSKRQQAEKELIELGYEALDYLPQADDRFSAEAKLRLRRIRKALEEARAMAEAEAKAFRLGQVNTLDEALTRISDLSGVQFARDNVANRPLVLNLGTQAFWPTLDSVLDAAELDVNFYIGDPGELGIVPKEEGRGSRTDAAAYAGVYRLETLAISARRDLRNPQLNGLSISTEIAWEPRLTPIGLNIPLDQITATFEDGQKLKPDVGQLDVSAGGSMPVSEFNIPFPLPTGSPRMIETLSGTIRSMLPGASEHFQVDLAKKHEPETVGSVTFWVEDVRANGTLHEVRVEVVFEDPGKAFESHRQWIFENPAYVTTADGQQLEHLGLQTYRQSADRVGIGYLYDLSESLESKTFHYKTPVSIISNEVNFVMKNIALP